MRIDLDARIRLADGTDAGVLQWAIVDPQTMLVTHFVVASDADGDPDIVVPRDEVDRATVEGDVLVLQVDAAALERFGTEVPVESGRIGVGKGVAVVDATGENAGVADELFYEEHTGVLRGFTVRLGGPLRTLLGGGDCVSVAAHQVERIGESTIYLNVSRDKLPALDPGASFTPNAG
ncbi:MAG TPA: hypothetical protein VFX49_22425 [Chloroflexota bacterium]|nr:hypothetical protein [Chloroflexota bacterium]